MTIEYYVRYKIPHLTQDKLHKDGPYYDYGEAYDHYLDIKSFEGITNCYLCEISNNERT